MNLMPALLLAALLLGTVGCTGSAEDSQPDPVFAQSPCPEDVAGVVFGGVECGYVTVPLRHDAPGAADDTDVEVFVVRLSPPGGAQEVEPVLVAGTNLGAVPNYLGIAPLAQRTGREVVIVDPRGTGHSLPLLDCPQVHETAAAHLSVPSSEETRQQMVQAVESCHARLSDEGIDVSAFGIAEMAQDLEDVRVALGIERWAVTSYGSASRIVAELMRRHPQPVTAVVLDSPFLPGMDPLASAERRLVQVIGRLLRSCRRDADCERRYGGPDLTLAAALRTVAVEPIVLRVGAGRIVLDEEQTLRALRALTSDGTSSGISLTLDAAPSIVRQIVDRDTVRLRRGLGQILLAQEPFCLGRSPNCLPPRHHLAVGTWLTVTCGDLLPASDPPADGSLTGIELCEAWPVDEADPELDTQVSWDQPTLIAVGRYATYSPLASVRVATKGLEDVTWLVDPAGGHNVLPRPCPVTIRDAWLQDPGGHVDRTCLAREHLDWAAG